MRNTNTQIILQDSKNCKDHYCQQRSKRLLNILQTVYQIRKVLDFAGRLPSAVLKNVCYKQL